MQLSKIKQMLSDSLRILNKFGLLLIVSFILLRPFYLGNTPTSYNLLITIMLYVGCLLYIISKKGIYKMGGYNLSIFLFVLSLVLSLIISGNIESNLPRLFSYISLPLIAYIISQTNTKEKNYIIFVILLGAFILSLHAMRAFFVVMKYIPEYLDKNNLNYPFAQEFLSRKRAFSPFFLPNLLAGYLIMIVPIFTQSFIQAISEKKIPKTIFTILGFILTFTILFLTKSLGAWIALFAAVLTLLFIKKKYNKMILLVLALIFLCFVGILLYRLNHNQEQASPLFSLKQRLSYFKDTISIIKNQPFLGVGLGNFSLKNTRFAHNSYLQIWAELGILGLLSWIAIIFSFLVKGIRSIKKSTASSGLFIAGMAFLMHNMIDFSFFEPQVSFLWWVILGLIINNDKNNKSISTGRNY